LDLLAILQLPPLMAIHEAYAQIRPTPDSAMLNPILRGYVSNACPDGFLQGVQEQEILAFVSSGRTERMR